MAPLREVHSLKLQLCAGPNMHVVNYTNKIIAHCRTYIT